MTSIGFAILDYFSQCLDTRYPGGKRVLSLRDAYILRKLYCWEEMTFSKEKELAKELKRSAERIRQLKKRSLKKLRTGAKQRKSPVQKIIGIIEGYAKKDERKQMYKTIVRFWLDELPEFPAYQIITLLASLYFGRREDIDAALEYFYSWERARVNEKRRQITQARRKLRNEARLKDEILGNIIWFDLVRKWKKEAFEGKEPKRKVNHNEKYFSGEIFSPKCNRFIQHESGVEYEFIKKLEANPSVLYYLDQPAIIQYTRNDIDYQYTPDFAVLLDDCRCFITEVKFSYAEMLDARVHRRMEALIEFCEKNGMGLLLTNGRYSLNYLANYPCTPGL
jgi:hypothetical protein